MAQGLKRQQDRLLLQRLLMIKARKEDSFRRQLGKLNQKQQALTEEIQRLLIKRRELQQLIRDSRIPTGVEMLFELTQYKARAVRWHNQERSLADIATETEQRREQLQQEIEGVRRAMLRVIKSQEKLQVVINEYSDANQRN